MSTVYVIQRPNLTRTGFPLDLSDARRFGELKMLFESGEQPSLLPVPSINKMRRWLLTFKDDDYLLWAGGDPAALAIAIGVVCDINRGCVPFLRWERKHLDGINRQRGYYVPVVLDFRGRKSANKISNLDFTTTSKTR